MRINFVLLAFAEAACRLFDDDEQPFLEFVEEFLEIHSVLASALEFYMCADAEIADIPFEEERRMVGYEQPIRDNQFFRLLSDTQLRAYTNFPRPALRIIKAFLKLPHVMYIHTVTGELIGEDENHSGCRLFFDEEMILFGMMKLAKGLRTTVLVDGIFGGDIARWSVGFRFFLRHVRKLVYPRIVGFEGIRRFVRQFPAFAACLERSMEKPRVIRGRDGVEREVPGRLFINGEFNLVGTFDCHIQKTNVPGSGPDKDGHRRPDAYDIQEAVYSGHKKMHGVKAFTCMLANGISFMHRPISARR